MKYKASIQVMPQGALLDPQGKAVSHGLREMGYQNIDNVRIGKNITLEITAADEAEAKSMVEASCKKLLANLIMETYTFTLTPLE
jgi:phosphoribosylformylglycinamidine synthase PurS subunit